MNNITKEIKYLGYYQLIGGVIGLGLIIYQLINTPLKGSNIVVYILLNSLFLFSIYAGKLCIDNHKKCLLISKINQALQVISVGLMGFSYMYVAGIYLNVGVDLMAEDWLQLGGGVSSVELAYSSTKEKAFVMVNVIAFFLIARIIKLENKLVSYQVKSGE